MFQGKVRSQPMIGRARAPPRDWEDICNAYPSAREYHYPDRFDEDEIFVARELEETKNPGGLVVDGITDAIHEEARCELLRQALEACGDVMYPPWFDNDWCLPQPRDVLNSVLRLKSDSNPGFPLNRIAGRKRLHAVENFPDVYHAVCMKLLYLRIVDKVTGWNPVTVERSKIRDPCQLILKNELKKIAKRTRGIYAVSYVDELVEKLVAGPLFRALKEHYAEFWSCIGFGADAEGVEKFKEHLPDGLWAHSDVPTFDFSMYMEEQVWFSEFICGMYAANRPLDYRARRMIMNLAIVASIWCVVLSCGIVLASSLYGADASGRDFTSLLNTFVRAFRAFCVQYWAKAVKHGSLTRAIEAIQDGDEESPQCRANGDDCIERPMAVPEAVYARFGWRIRDYAIDEDFVSFCSHHIPLGAGVAYPERIVKGTTNVLYKDPLPYDELIAYVREFKDHPDFADHYGVVHAFRVSSRRPPAETVEMNDFDVSSNSTLDQATVRLCSQRRPLSPCGAPPSKFARTTFSDHPDVWPLSDPPRALWGRVRLTKTQKPFVGPLLQNGKKGRTGKKKRGQGEQRLVVRGPTIAQSVTPQKVKPPADLVERGCALIDPFCDAANGAKYPDSFGVNSLTIRDSSIYAITTNSNGTVAIAIWASADTYWVSSPVAAAGVTTFLAGPDVPGSANYTTAAGGFKEARLVTAGCRFWSALPATAAGGYVEICDLAPRTLDGAIITAGSLDNGVPNSRRQDIRKEFTWIAHPTTKMYKEFGTISTSSTPAASLTNERFSGFIAVFTGPASSVVGYLEVVRNVEFTQQTSTGTIPSRLLTMNKPRSSDSIVTAAIERARGMLDPVMEVGKKAAAGMVQNAVSMAMGAASNYFFPGSGLIAGGVTRKALKGWQSSAIMNVD